ncbi:E3 SUMO-protein ligase ZBED1-like [Macrobrachium nipponense]|uniref:E3 SUMO-protein ligase ZBED1-like n=1 Tax=Macrobrachium nipponense TaxID=159736 RepID=UPI0030C8A973
MDSGARKRPRTRSVIWNYLEKDIKAPMKAKCMKCMEKLQCSKNTSNLFKHLCKKHPLEYDNAMEEKEAHVPVNPTAAVKQPSIQETIQKTLQYPHDSEKAKLLDKHLINMITIDMQPASIVEDDGFRKFVKALDGCYNLHSGRKIMREMLPKMYNETRIKLAKLLDEAKSVTITTDIWTSRKTQAFICFTGHFITSSWIHKSVILETAQLTQDHTAEMIRSEIERVANEWKISEKNLL